LCLLGFKTRGQAVAAELFRNQKIDVYTEDGSMGMMGLVSEPLPEILAEMQTGEIFACGPDAMLAALSVMAGDHGVNAQVSMAAHMACGVGACQGCVIRTVDGYRRVCSEGPVFAAGEIAW
ncbi:MAG: dihydroorotate dehydrogenase electron transfer subunit, partial [Actinomycetota bacterium]